MLKTDDISIKKMAILMAVNCVRNTVLEDYHSDGKISQEEICNLNKEVVNKIYTFLTFSLSSDKLDRIAFEELMALATPTDWDEPKLDDEFIKAFSFFNKTSDN